MKCIDSICILHYRERAAHELRRHGLSPIDTSARLSRLSGGSPTAISPLVSV